jgi:hypothetical protein
MSGEREGEGYVLTDVEARKLARLLRTHEGGSSTTFCPSLSPVCINP